MTLNGGFMMKKHNFRRILACALALCAVICSVMTGAQAATYQKVFAAVEGANLYKSASTESAVLRDVPLNGVVTVGIAKSSWCYVKYDGTAGYMRTADLTDKKVESDGSTGGTNEAPAPEGDKAPEQSAPASPSSVAAVIKQTTKLYENARTDASSYCTLYAGTKVTCLKVSGSWARVSYNGQTGYVPKAMLAKDTDPAPADPVVPEQPEQQPGEDSGSSSQSVKVRTLTAAKFYKRPDTASGSLATVPKGKEFICLKTSGEWARVQIGSKTGYMLKSALILVSDENAGVGGEAPEPEQPEQTPPSTSSGVICYLKADNALYAAPSTTAESAASLKKGDKVLVVQVKSGWAKLYTEKAVLGYLPSSVLSKTYVAPAVQVVLEDWFKGNIQSVFPRGSVVKVIDVATGKAFNARRTGGINHVDAEPATDSDTATMLSIYGGQWSWDRKAIWVVIDGTYYAASMNGMGHGGDPNSGVSNEFEGVFCIHFLNSRTHGTDNVCPDHQAAIKEAYTTKP